jgi:phosphoglycolate phosphatase
MKIIRPIPIDQIKLLIFDLDGTLVDSKLDLANSVNAMLRHLHHPELPVETIGTYIGDGAPILVRRALGDPDDEQYVHGALEYFIRHYREHKLDTTYIYPGILEALHAIRASGNGNRKMAVLTNKPVVPSRGIVEGLGLGEFFVQVYGGNSFHTKKPDPHGALKLLQETGTRAEQAVIIGDSSNDILTGRNAGMWTVGLTYGFAPHTLENPEPDVLLDKPEELAELFAAPSHK